MTVHLTSVLFVLIISYIVFLLSLGGTQKLHSICHGFICLLNGCSGCIWSIVFHKIFFHSLLLKSPFLYQLSETLHIALTNYCISRSVVIACIRFKTGVQKLVNVFHCLGCL